jgi:hypothetical protein
MNNASKIKHSQFLTACQQVTIRRLEVMRKRLQDRVEAWEAKYGKPNEAHPHLDDLRHGGWPSRRQERAMYLRQATAEVEAAEKDNMDVRRDLEDFLMRN